MLWTAGRVWAWSLLGGRGGGPEGGSEGLCRFQHSVLGSLNGLRSISMPMHKIMQHLHYVSESNPCWWGVMRTAHSPLTCCTEMSSSRFQVLGTA